MVCVSMSFCGTCVVCVSMSFCGTCVVCVSVEVLWCSWFHCGWSQSVGVSVCSWFNPSVAVHDC